MRRTLNCIICGKMATNHSGHVHLPDGTRIVSGLCDEHVNNCNPGKGAYKYRCKSGCDGDYQSWMKDSGKNKRVANKFQKINITYF